MFLKGETMKCSKCKEIGDSSYFYKDSKHGLQRYCKMCLVHIRKEHYIKNRDKILNKLAIKNSNMNPEQLKIKTKENNIKSKYSKLGISIDIYYKALKDQNNKCYICKQPPSIKSLHIDHCHKTGTFRGLLCTRCNTGLGLFKDNISIIEEAINYLNRKLYV